VPALARKRRVACHSGLTSQANKLARAWPTTAARGQPRGRADPGARWPVRGQSVVGACSGTCVAWPVVTGGALTTGGFFTSSTTEARHTHRATFGGPTRTEEARRHGGWSSLARGGGLVRRGDVGFGDGSGVGVRDTPRQHQDEEGNGLAWWLTAAVAPQWCEDGGGCRRRSVARLACSVTSSGGSGCSMTCSRREMAAREIDRWRRSPWQEDFGDKGVWTRGKASYRHIGYGGSGTDRPGRPLVHARGRAPPRWLMDARLGRWGERG
jgi:hypothetical protein